MAPLSVPQVDPCSSTSNIGVRASAIKLQRFVVATNRGLAGGVSMHLRHVSSEGISENMQTEPWQCPYLKIVFRVSQDPLLNLR